MEDAFLGCHVTIQKVILAMFITTTLTLINFAALLDAIVTVHQVIQNAADFVVLMKRKQCAYTIKSVTVRSTVLATRTATSTCTWYVVPKWSTT